MRAESDGAESLVWFYSIIEYELYTEYVLIL